MRLIRNVLRPSTIDTPTLVPFVVLVHRDDDDTGLAVLIPLDVEVVGRGRVTDMRIGTEQHLLGHAKPVVDHGALGRARSRDVGVIWLRIRFDTSTCMLACANP